MLLPRKVNEYQLFKPIWKKSATTATFINPRTGRRYEWPVFRVAAPPVNIVFALTPDLKVIAISKFMHGANAVMMELPGGLCGEGESAEDAARRELSEETGHRAAALDRLSSAPVYFEPGSLDFRFQPFLALNCEKVAEQSLDLNEDIEVVLIRLQEWLGGIESGAISTDAKSMAATLLALRRLKCVG